MLLLDLVMAFAVCACCGWIGIRAQPSFERPQREGVISPRPTKVAVLPTITPSLPTPTPPIETILPTRTPSRTHLPDASRPGDVPIPERLATISAEPGSAFSIDMTETELNDYLAGKVYEAQGIKIEEIQVSLLEQELLGTFRATQQQTGLSVGLSVRGVPSVAAGKAYFKVNDVALDSSVKGLARLLARAAIEEAIKQYSTPHGIPIPIEGVEFESIELSRGRLFIAGRRSQP